MANDSDLEDEIQEDSLPQYLCVVCKSSSDEAQTIICDKCDKGYHADCHNPKVDMTSVP